MTEAWPAKLALRLLAAGLLYLYLPRLVMSAAWSLTMSSPLAIKGLALAAAVAAAVAGVVLWIQAGRLAVRLLPAKTAGDIAVPPAAYARLQESGLMFIGGCLLLRACLDLHILLFGDAAAGMAGDVYLLPFNIVAALFLLAGSNTIAALVRRRAD